MRKRGLLDWTGPEGRDTQQGDSRRGDFDRLGLLTAWLSAQGELDLEAHVASLEATSSWSGTQPHLNLNLVFPHFPVWSLAAWRMQGRGRERTCHVPARAGRGGGMDGKGPAAVSGVSDDACAQV